MQIIMSMTNAAPGGFLGSQIELRLFKIEANNKQDPMACCGAGQSWPALGKSWFSTLIPVPLSTASPSKSNLSMYEHVEICVRMNAS